MLTRPFQHYHSIHARGEKVEDVLAAAKASSGEASSWKEHGNQDGSSNPSLSEGEIENEEALERDIESEVTNNT